MNVSTPTVSQYLLEGVGRGFLRRSDVFFSLPRELRRTLEEGLTAWAGRTPPMVRDLWRDGMDHEEVHLFLAFRDMRVALGDMYEWVRDIELTLHRAVRCSLLKAYGEASWWRRGVPSSVRVDCASDLERDEEPAPEPYAYTTLLQLARIFEASWDVLRELLPTDYQDSRSRFVKDLQALNRIRNGVMHPVRGLVPSEREFEFVRTLHARLVATASARLPEEEQSLLSSPRVERFRDSIDW